MTPPTTGQGNTRRGLINCPQDKCVMQNISGICKTKPFYDAYLSFERTFIWTISGFIDRFLLLPPSLWIFQSLRSSFKLIPRAHFPSFHLEERKPEVGQLMVHCVGVFFFIYSSLSPKVSASSSCEENRINLTKIHAASCRRNSHRELHTLETKGKTEIGNIPQVTRDRQSKGSS